MGVAISPTAALTVLLRPGRTDSYDHKDFFYRIAYKRLRDHEFLGHLFGFGRGTPGKPTRSEIFG
jgi:hypothetical protein